MDNQERRDLAMALIPVIRTAGMVVLTMRAKLLQTTLKPDASPVTAADLESEAIIRDALGRICPTIPIVGEESFQPGQLPAHELSSYFLVDPIDGTKEFIAGRQDFAVNIAIVERGFPTLGMVFAPAIGRLFLADRPGEAFEEETDRRLRKLRCGELSSRKRLIVLASRSHLDDATKSLMSGLQPHVTRRLGSSLKFALIAAGEADFYPRLAPTMAWDSAAGQALVEAAGGVVLRPDGSRLGYAMAHGLRNEGFVVARNAALAQEGLRQPPENPATLREEPAGSQAL